MLIGINVARIIDGKAPIELDFISDAAKEIAGVGMHLCAFAALLAKNMVFKLVLLGGKLYTVCSDAAFASKTDLERLHEL